MRDRQITGYKNTTGDLALRWEVARGWRLGRRAFCKLCEAEDPFEVELDQESRRGKQIIVPGACVPRAFAFFSLVDGCYPVLTVP